ncbi:MAG TPA: ABC transporter substrate-binding protein [Chitinophaga sp.]|uniref:ABC transporter substrate-binding protein n=1 Tax=Chitinophaga sp. TaxID=1869181 RepID=UPI002D112399|nr:ABC transporter substrate-binding protein [Chitinophaga sp.]HVI45060.1 ABC transporter substrate-binding protein [Chitinophaga sp.]
MKQSLTVGVLTPYSGIYPYYASYLTTGWLLGMGLDPARQQTIRFVSEYTHMGSANATETAARKLLFFDRVDILSGLISYKSVHNIIPLMEKRPGTAFFFDMGEYVPHFPNLSPHVFYLSLQLWQSQYALGAWAFRHFGDGGHIIMPVYEAGYHLDNTFQQGASDAGGNTLHITVLPHHPGEESSVNFSDLFARLHAEAPPYVHAIFCGAMGSRFLQQWIAAGMHKKIPLVVNETMVYDDILEDVKHIDIELYSSVMWMRDDERKENNFFVKQFENIARQPANIYAMMGYEAGLIWKELLPLAMKDDWSTVKQLLRERTITGPRGEASFYPQAGFALPSTNIIKVKISGQQIKKIILDQGKGMLYNAAQFDNIHNESVSGWQNPFLCI